MLLALAPAAGLAAAGLEYAWFALATNLPAERILAANLDITFGLRPAVWVAVAAVAMPLLARRGWSEIGAAGSPGCVPAPAGRRSGSGKRRAGDGLEHLDIDPRGFEVTSAGISGIGSL